MELLVRKPPSVDVGSDQVACPVTSAVRVILPGTHEFGTAIVSIAPCEGLVQVSPIVPGADRLTF
jgi:hypothetical protein